MTLPDLLKVIAERAENYAKKVNYRNGNEWPMDSDFWIDVEEHSEDGTWSGYVISKNHNFRPADPVEGVLKEKHDVAQALITGLIDIVREMDGAMESYAAFPDMGDTARTTRASTLEKLRALVGKGE